MGTCPLIDFPTRSSWIQFTLGLVFIAVTRPLGDSRKFTRLKKNGCPAVTDKVALAGIGLGIGVAGLETEL